MPAIDVPGPDDDRELETVRLHLDDLTGDRRQPLRVDAVRLLAHQRFAGELQQQPVKRRAGLAALLLGGNRLGHSARA